MGHGLGLLFITSSSSHFYSKSKTDFDLYLLIIIDIIFVYFSCDHIDEDKSDVRRTNSIKVIHSHVKQIWWKNAGKITILIKEIFGLFLELINLD